LKKNLLASVAAVALIAAGPALAADLPLKAPPAVVAAVWSWSGFYVGAHGGYGWGHDSLSDFNDPFFVGKFPTFTSTGVDPKGALGGLQAGANWQAGSIVGGLEGDLSFTDIKGSSLSIPTPVVSAFSSNAGSAANSGTFDLLGSGRGRLGYLATPNVLLYGTGGLAWTRFVQNTDQVAVTANIPPPGSFGIFGSTSVPTWRFGWVAGLGAEARLFDTNWLARLEYLHYDFGNSGSASAPVVAMPSSRSSGNLTLDVVRAGLSYKFDPDRVALGYAGAIAPAMYTKAPAVAQPWSWSGFYLGAHAGYGWARDPFSNLPLVGTVTLSGVDSSGFVGGVQAGANWQSGRVVGGLEIDLSGSGIKGSGTNVVPGAAGIVDQATQTDKIDWFGSTRARLGYLVTPSLLLYGTGGPGWARMVSDQETVSIDPVRAPPVISTSLVTPSWMFGWTAGLGAEARLWNTNWLARVEYLHYDFGSRGFTQFIAPPGPVATISFGHVTNDVVRAGLSYKLDWPGVASAGPAAMPVKAAYAAIWSWSGFYLGGNVGYGWGRDPFTTLAAANGFTLPPINLNGVNSQGFVGGFDAGANWQTGSVVGGLEIDLSGSDIKGSSSAAGITTLGTLAVTQTDKFELLGSGRARLGYLVWPGVLLYGTGGLGWTHLEQTLTSMAGPTLFNPATTTITTTPSWRFGWVAGAGGEARLWNSNWTARLEYLHYDFGNSGSVFGGFTISGFPTFITGSSTSQHLTADVVRTGIGYKFD
jgi:outer membrane immunogenic protein